LLSISERKGGKKDQKNSFVEHGFVPTLDDDDDDDEEAVHDTSCPVSLSLFFDIAVFCMSIYRWVFSTPSY